MERLEDFATAVVTTAGSPAGRPRLVAIDGRGGGGKSALAERLSRAVPGSTTVHTDDVAWWHSRFGWADLMAEGILMPLRAGEDVRYQPPAWKKRGRQGVLDVPATSTMVFIEGVGAARRELTHLIDAAIWVQSDFDLAMQRGLVRDMRRDGTDLASAQREWDAWAAEEVPFLSRDRPWDRADFIVAGTPPVNCDPAVHVVTAPPLPQQDTDADAT